jgi:lipoate-protein ligase A
MGMNNTQIDHLNRVLEQVREIITEKYVAGTKEYNTTLSEAYTVEELIIEGIKENADGIVYGLTALEVLRRERNERA